MFGSILGTLPTTTWRSLGKTLIRLARYPMMPGSFSLFYCIFFVVVVVIVVVFVVVVVSLAHYPSALPPRSHPVFTMVCALTCI